MPWIELFSLDGQSLGLHRDWPAVQARVAEQLCYCDAEDVRVDDAYDMDAAAKVKRKIDREERKAKKDAGE